MLKWEYAKEEIEIRFLNKGEIGICRKLKCPNCGEVFVVDRSGYAQIVQQVRDKEFDKELRRREEELAGKQESELRLLGGWNRSRNTTLL